MPNDNEYTPSMDEIRARYQAASRNRFGHQDPKRVTDAEFARALAAHDREVAEKAWDAGLNTGIGYKTAMDVLGTAAPEPVNPYRGTPEQEVEGDE